MHKTNFFIGMGIGAALGGAVGLSMMSKKKNPKNIVGRTLKTMGEVVDAVSDSMGL